MSPRVAVVVVTYDSSDVLPGLLDSLPAGLRPLPWELVVVDNGSTDGSADLVGSRMPGATIVRTGRNGGYAAGINAGVAAAGPHDAVLVLNPDVRLDPGCVQTLCQALGAPDVGVAVPRLRDGQGRLIESMRREPTLPRAAADAFVGARRAGRWFGEVVSDPAAYQRRQVVDWAEGSTQLISRRCWDDVGPWDESYFLYSEETDFGLRARDRGWGTVFVPEADAVHLEGGSDRSPRMWPLVVANRVRLYSRRHRAPAAAVFWGTQVVREASRAALGREEAKAALRVLLSPRRLAASPGPEWLR